MRAFGRCVLAAVLAAALLSPSGVAAGFVSGGDLLESCKPQPIDPVFRLKIAECHGYVVAIADSFDCGQDARGFTWDSTTHVSQRDLVAAVVTWLGKHPRQLGYQANGLVAAALSETYPCRAAAAPASGSTAAAQ